MNQLVVWLAYLATHAIIFALETAFKLCLAVGTHLDISIVEKSVNTFITSQIGELVRVGPRSGWAKEDRVRGLGG